MKIYKELKEIAEMNKKIESLDSSLCSNFSVFVTCDLKAAYLIEDCYVENGHLYTKEKGKLDNCGLVYDTYYCCQVHGYGEDDYYGTLYFATDEKGTFVAVPFNC